jgi:type IV secretory pathway VirB3-like protein
LRKLDHDILLSLADALELTTMERKEFFFAAMSLDNSHLVSPKRSPSETLNTLLCMLESINLPAIILDVFSDVIAINTTAITLFDIHDDLINYPADLPAAHNMMRIIFSRDSNFRAVLNEEWSRCARRNMHVFRGVTLRYRFHSYFKQLLPALWKHPAFRLYWEQAYLEDQDNSMDSLIYEYNHRKFGHVRYMANASSSMTKLGELHWIIYIPLDQRTTNVFQELIQNHGNAVRSLAPWPKQEA